MTNGITLSGDLVTKIVVAVLAIYAPTSEIITANQRSTIKDTSNDACEASEDLREDILGFLARQNDIRNRDQFLDQADRFFRQPEC